VEPDMGVRMGADMGVLVKRYRMKENCNVKVNF
jgi:hypothetical protein